jgi:hypothetical protein
MKYIQVLFFLLLLLVLGSCAKDSGEDETPLKISDEVIEQAKKELLEQDVSEVTTKIKTKTILLNAKKWEYDQKEIRVKK